MDMSKDSLLALEGPSIFAKVRSFVVNAKKVADAKEVEI